VLKEMLAFLRFP
jgi:addiction module HigA family antidote